MFLECRALTGLDLSGFDTSQVTSMREMFRSCSFLVTISANSDWNTEIITSLNSMFCDCTNLVGVVAYDSSKLDITMDNPTTGYFIIKNLIVMAMNNI